MNHRGSYDHTSSSADASHETAAFGIAAGPTLPNPTQKCTPGQVHTQPGVSSKIKGAAEETTQVEAPGGRHTWARTSTKVGKFVSPFPNPAPSFRQDTSGQI